MRESHSSPPPSVFTSANPPTTCSLPILVQPEVIKKALSAGKHVLSEKPIAPDLAAARELIKWRRSNIPATTNWSVAENVRFCETWRFARRSILSLGRILNFSVEASCLVAPGGKWYETEWRKTPSHQGGFLLDGGVHHTAGIILLLGEEDVIEKVAAFSAQVQSHLPPVDTVSAVLRTKKGVTGWLGMSFGTTFDKFEFSVACEGGVVTAMRGKVIVKRVGKEAEETLFPDDKAGVAQEVEGFAQALIKGEADKRQTPELALGDLELVSLFFLWSELVVNVRLIFYVWIARKDATVRTTGRGDLGG